ncbi:CTP:phosphocholine cytidylyltransferase-like protein [Salana multivorans]|uniref:CTP:phosphocholine cytidylyltransferase-like protein n=1 Tax=Salana multivorans TaxID=120377 RepID=A0A3N2D7I8_9MICO|nr:phosphotransferase [Salana multivorans]ROR95741.1 CTP:phosphocholine cytidylyltransferase-like protein [Salana multivorans]
MALPHDEFRLLVALTTSGEIHTDAGLSDHLSLPQEDVTEVLARCEQHGYVSDGRLTDLGCAALEPYRVDNAVIMAAGFSQRFAPISYEKPKGVLKVRGEILIERQIRQLLEAGITDITVVVGYRAEYYFYLASKYGVDIVVNPDYATRDNSSSLWVVRERLGNTFVCSSDDYFTENPFERYVYGAYYAATYVEGETEEWCILTDEDDVITAAPIGGADAWVMLGHVYFDRAFSTRFREILEEVYHHAETERKPWETVYLDHVDQLPMRIRRYPDGVIYEFDSLDEVQGFDAAFIENVNSRVLDNIARTLGCEKSDITDFYPLKQGITNLSCHFSFGGAEYVYRHPGIGTEKMIDRVAETAALELAKELGLDTTFLVSDPAEGWKISHFVPNARTLEDHDPAEVRIAMEMGRRLHESGAQLDRRFDYLEEGHAYEELLEQYGPIDVPGYEELKRKAIRLKSLADADGYPLVPSHNDFFGANFLISDSGEVNLIDWEYAGMSDPANDFGTFAVSGQLDEDEMHRALEYHLGRPATFEETRHFFAYTALAGWCWYVWALAKEAQGGNVGEWLYVYYRYAVDYLDKVLDWYENDAATTETMIETGTHA